MTVKQVKDTSAIALIVVYVVVLASVFILQLSWPRQRPRPFMPDEIWAIIEVLVPLFAAFIGMIVTYFSKNMYRDRSKSGRPVSFVYVFMLFLFIFGIFVVQIAGLWLKADEKISFGDLQKMLAFSQTAFGVYLAKFINELFS